MYRKKLIEVALPLEAINKASAREKSIRHGHPSTLHLWWARRPLATCRAVLFSSLVDDPSSLPEEFPTEEAQEVERQRLFRIIEDLVKWENTNNETVLEAARAEIMKSTNGNPPPVYDPFCGGGSIPLEAQRLGLEAHGSDLNPVAVLITKALIEIPPKFAGRPPVNPESRKKESSSLVKDDWKGAAGLAADVRYYGQWMRDEAEKKIGHLYPKVKITKKMTKDRPDLEPYVGQELTSIAWLWARTVKCPNPACGAEMPLVRSFDLSTKKGKGVHVEPVVKGKKYRFEVKVGGKAPGGTVNRRGARCLCCDTSVPFNHIRSEGRSGRMGARLMSVVAEGARKRVYIAPVKEHAAIAARAKPDWVPDTELPEKALSFRVQVYGMTRHADLFTSRQLVALTTFSDLVGKARERVKRDAVAAGLADDPTGLEAGGTGAQAYADAVATYLAFALDKAADRNTSLCSWEHPMGRMRNTFGRQALPMVWDFAETNPFAGAAGDYRGTVESLCEVLDKLCVNQPGSVVQRDATVIDNDFKPMVSTDPPYYDNIGYADLSDFFYAWLRPTLKSVYPELMSTMQVPKAPELVATPYRFGGDKAKAKAFFEEGLGEAFARMREVQDPAYPFTVYYAFKQAATKETDESQVSTGWETMLEGLLKAGFSIDGTWPMRSELSNRMTASGTNALASSIVLVCRPRLDDAALTTRRDFQRALKQELPAALKKMQHGNIAPVDMAQSAIGPGMAVFSRYSKVLEADGTPMSVRTALGIINQILDEYLAEQEGDFDPETRFCVLWFEQFCMDEGEFGEADVLARAKNSSVDGMKTLGLIHATKGKVRLLKRDELEDNWTPTKDARVTVWKCAQHLARALETGGEDAAAKLCRSVGMLASDARALAYRLYSICDQKKWAREALAYNSLVVSWPAIQARVAQLGDAPIVGEQTELF